MANNNYISIPNPQDESVVIYRSEDATVTLDVQLADETVWLTQKQMAWLFDRTPQNITIHLGNVYKEKELTREATCKDFLQVQQEGGRSVQRWTKYYNLDVIISVGYRVKSQRGTQFRQWATRVLKDYLLKGYAVNQRLERLEQRVSKTEEQIGFFVRTSLPPTQGIFFDGQIFDAYTFVCDLVRQAKTRIVLIDNYVDDSVLSMLDKRSKGVKATIYTKTIPHQLGLDLEKHNAQYEPIEVLKFDKAHDRFLCIDETVYHLGASMKDLGKKWFAFSRMEWNATELLEKM